MTTPAEKGPGDWLIRRLIGAGADPAAPENRHKLGMAESRASIAISALLTVVKAALGAISGSISLVADAVNNLSDIGTSIIILLGFRLARKPRDNEHPFGHGRSELISGLVLSVILVVIGLEVGRSGIIRLLKPEAVHAPGWLVAVIALAVVLKMGMAWFAMTLARATGSTTLLADAWNHIFDIMSSGLVFLALVSARLGWGAVDGWAALLVAGFILATGIRCARDAINPLLGEAPSPENLRVIEAAASALKEVRGVHDIIVNAYGDTRIVSLHIEVDAALSALEAHDIAEKTEQAVEEALDCKAIVHVDPVDRAHPWYRAVEENVRAAVGGDARMRGFHDLRVYGRGGRMRVSVDILVSKDLPAEAYEAVKTAVSKAVRSAISRVQEVAVTIETEYSNETRV